MLFSTFATIIQFSILGKSNEVYKKLVKIIQYCPWII